jgi:hypothetical protein
MRWISALLLLSILSAALLSGCLDAGKAVRNVETSAGTASGSVPESTVGASHIDGDHAETNGPSSRDPFVQKTEDSGGSGYDADTVLTVRYGIHGDYERAVIDLLTSAQTSKSRSPAV